MKINFIQILIMLIITFILIKATERQKRKKIDKIKQIKIFALVIVAAISMDLIAYLNQLNINTKQNDLFKTELSGRLALVEESKNSVFTIKLNNENEERIFQLTHNNKEFRAFTKSGDSLYKASNSDSIFIIKSNEERRLFILDIHTD
jgi:hypothetical protein